MKTRRKASRKWWAMAPGMTIALARRFELGMTRGNTVKDLTSPGRKTYVVPESRYRVHCRLHPIWAKRIAKLNAASISKKHKETSGHGNATKKYCLRNLHRMTKANVLIDGVGHRRCRACRYISMAGKPMPADKVEQIKAAIVDGATFNQVCWGHPAGGGKRDPSLILTTAAKFQRQRRVDPDFDAFVTKHFEVSCFIGQSLRYNRDAPEEMKPTLLLVAKLRHKIKASGAELPRLNRPRPRAAINERGSTMSARLLSRC
ncbi:hypothetical protein IVB08_00210 [Bradyrhizobium sp. 173]|uniref:hypothetical protein n=1 Tax=Bradyrhizobium sp. 173 TaxID=2782644 RepID=UPI001FF97115|nr:hypothetical protein [Bradyrhizobium sp. 173]MCK1562434.1 hypothetical protein [Bradyrhizobium sp. 173]